MCSGYERRSVPCALCALPSLMRPSALAVPGLSWVPCLRWSPPCEPRAPLLGVGHGGAPCPPHHHSPRCPERCPPMVAPWWMWHLSGSGASRTAHNAVLGTGLGLCCIPGTGWGCAEPGRVCGAVCAMGRRLLGAHEPGCVCAWPANASHMSLFTPHITLSILYVYILY